MDAPPLADNPPNHIIQDDEFDRTTHSYFHGDDDCVDDDDDGVGGSRSGDVDYPVDGDSSNYELDYGDFFGQLLRHTKAEVLVASV